VPVSKKTLKARERKELIEKYLRSKGWFTWYNEAYWCNEKTIENEKEQDCTDYGMDMESALIFELQDLPKFQHYGCPQYSMRTQYFQNMEQINDGIKNFDDDFDGNYHR